MQLFIIAVAHDYCITTLSTNYFCEDSTISNTVDTLPVELVDAAHESPILLHSTASTFDRLPCLSALVAFTGMDN